MNFRLAAGLFVTISNCLLARRLAQLASQSNEAERNRLPNRPDSVYYVSWLFSAQVSLWAPASGQPVVQGAQCIFCAHHARPVCFDRGYVSIVVAAIVVVVVVVIVVAAIAAAVVVVDDDDDDDVSEVD